MRRLAAAVLLAASAAAPALALTPPAAGAPEPQVLLMGGMTVTRRAHGRLWVVKDKQVLEFLLPKDASITRNEREAAPKDVAVADAVSILAYEPATRRITILKVYSSKPSAPPTR